MDSIVEHILSPRGSAQPNFSRHQCIVVRNLALERALVRVRGLLHRPSNSSHNKKHDSAKKEIK